MTMGTVYGNCGTATLTGTGQGFFTAYNISDPWMGGPASHIWRVVVASANSYDIYNLDGRAPWFSSSWSATRSWSWKADFFNGWVSQGIVFGRTGMVCGALTPGDSWWG
ncbi:hypothetical protein [Arthrobacter sp. AZCC_0090]|uniref:hypothetical protein n=1 Tax=Arthrobacter sp. AZCC_0090 TaxID=2735881 RepID=UPI001620F571|nr:hypothetical protein [Arthrobacter sp. AZCC_0090]MBB6403543.1 hypothetical protein [Arthrobacter sp. AZCC_0090]